MNQKQLNYFLQKYCPAEDIEEFFKATLSAGSICALQVFDHLGSIYNVSPSVLILTTQIILGAKGFQCLKKSKKYLKKRLEYYKLKRDAKKNPHITQTINTITFQDTKGLEHLLERTREKEKLEWGTVMDIDVYDTNAFIQEVFNSHEAEKFKFLFDRQPSKIMVNIPLIQKKGWNGIQHYHPSGSNAANYVISYTDKSVSGEMIEFITFNMPEGPEIIGYNLFHTFISEDETKRTLIKATHKDIMKYLA